jgi:RNA polymerase sigma factor (sigma-70 family)
MQETASKQDLTPEQALWERQHLQAALLDDKEDLLQAIRPRLSRLAQVRGVPADAIEDVVQETLLEAWRHLDRLHSLQGLQPWLEEICRNVCRRYARRYWSDMQHAASFLPTSPFDEENAGDGEAPSLEMLPDGNESDLSEAISRQDLAILLNRALGLLPEPARQVVELCYLGELPQREAAQRLGISVSALEARLHRARLQLRQVLKGPLRQEALALGLTLGEEANEGWKETRLWCSLCGRRRLRGTFVPASSGGVDLRLECPDCQRRYGVQSLHSMGLVKLGKVRAFRPAWKRTLQAQSDQLLAGLARGWRTCAHCGLSSPVRVIDNAEMARVKGAKPRVPYQFWVSWKCPHCQDSACPALTADELTYWSHQQARKFILDHPRWISEPDEPVVYAGQQAIHFRMTDRSSAAHLDIFAQRQTLHILAIR